MDMKIYVVRMSSHQVDKKFHTEPFWFQAFKTRTDVGMSLFVVLSCVSAKEHKKHQETYLNQLTLISY